MQSIIFKAFSPEFFLSISTILILVSNAYIINNLQYNFPLLEKEILFQVFFILFCALVLMLNVNIEGYIYGMLLISDKSGILIRLIILSTCLVSLILVWRGFVLQKINFFEYFIIYLFAILSSLLLVSAYDFLSVYLILEMQTIGFYILASFYRTSAFSSEAGLKYFISSTLMSGVFLFGCALIYGCVGTLNFNFINIIFLFNFPDETKFLYYIFLLGNFLIIIVFLFKLSVAPYQFWFPQIYDGAPISSTIIFSLLPKIVMFTILIRWLLASISTTSLIMPFLLLTGAYSVVFGTFLALKQKKLKKFFIYSSISQIGLPICALSVISLRSVLAIYFFLIIYMITSILMWGVFLFISESKKALEKSSSLHIYPIYITAFSNLFTFNKAFALAALVLFFSMAGMPPLVGFFAKFYVYFYLIFAQFYDIAIFLICIGAYSVFYYIRVLKVMFFENKNVYTLGSQYSVFSSPYLSVECLIYATMTYLLVACFFYPKFLWLLCHLIAASFFGI